MHAGAPKFAQIFFFWSYRLRVCSSYWRKYFVVEEPWYIQLYSSDLNTALYCNAVLHCNNALYLNTSLYPNTALYCNIVIHSILILLFIVTLHCIVILNCIAILHCIITVQYIAPVGITRWILPQLTFLAGFLLQFSAVGDSEAAAVLLSNKRKQSLVSYIIKEKCSPAPPQLLCHAQGRPRGGRCYPWPSYNTNVTLTLAHLLEMAQGTLLECWNSADWWLLVKDCTQNIRG